jgi:hypothetical protein
MKKLLTIALVFIGMTTFAKENKMPAWAIKQAKKSVNTDIKKLSRNETAVLWKAYQAAFNSNDRETFAPTWNIFIETAKPFYGGYVFLQKGPSDACICNKIKLMYASIALPDHPFMLWGGNLPAGEPAIVIAEGKIIITADSNIVSVDYSPGNDYAEVQFMGFPPDLQQIGVIK